MKAQTWAILSDSCLFGESRRYFRQVSASEDHETVQIFQLGPLLFLKQVARVPTVPLLCSTSQAQNTPGRFVYQLGREFF